jgi:hypothetical protein
MKHISELERILSQLLNWNKDRISCLVQILQALFCVKTVNLAQIANNFHTSAKQDSSYRRVRRFFKDFFFDMSIIVIVVLNLFIKDGKFTLLLDRTNWKWGQKHINILMLSVGYHGISIPLFWIVSDKGGNASLDNRIELLIRAVKRFGIKRIEVLLADREFVGSKWFEFLIRKKIPFVIRTKKNFKAGGIEPYRLVAIGKLLEKLGPKKKMLNYPILLWGQLIYVSIRLKNNAKEPMIVLSNYAFPKPIDLYRKRWGIETLFSHLKTRGFRMEDTHLTCSKRIEKLLFILAIAFCWALKTGEVQSKKIPIKIKKHGRKEKSIFRIGFDLIRSSISKVFYKFEDFLSLLLVLSPCISKEKFL